MQCTLGIDDYEESYSIDPVRDIYKDYLTCETVTKEDLVTALRSSRDVLHKAWMNSGDLLYKLEIDKVDVLISKSHL